MIRRQIFVLTAITVSCSILQTVAIAAPTIWTGPSITFSKPTGGLPSDPNNRDILTANVVLKRGTTQGMFNFAQEASAGANSPADTQWATDLTSPSQIITATNHAALTFTTWQAAYNNNPGANTVSRDAVVHLLTDDIYLNLKFTAFQGGGSGGQFTYVRSTPVPEPGTLALLTGVTGLGLVCRRLFSHGIDCGQN